MRQYNMLILLFQFYLQKALQDFTNFKTESTTIEYQLLKLHSYNDQI